jgi:hypothetical protein
MPDIYNLVHIRKVNDLKTTFWTYYIVIFLVLEMHFLSFKIQGLNFSWILNDFIVCYIDGIFIFLGKKKKKKTWMTRTSYFWKA